MIGRGQNFKQYPLQIAGSSTFGRYPKISIEKTYNMYISDKFLVNYGGYSVAIKQNRLGTIGRGIRTSTKLNRLITVINNNVYLVNIFYNKSISMSQDIQIIRIGTLNTSVGLVWIAENNKPQILISDNVSLYVYDPTLTPAFQQVTDLNFTPGYIDFHDTYFICAASADNTYAPPADNTWRLSAQNNGLSWPSIAQNVGLLQTKPDNTKGIVRVPSKGNMILVLGETVGEPWFDTGAQLFPYQRNNQYSIDYGLLSPGTLATNDEIAVWLAQNEKSGPIIVFSNGGMPKKITTDGIDYFFSTLKNPSDSRAFLYRQDGHLFYHINFYTDNLSLFYDFNTDKFYHACDENLNYFIADQVAFFNNQYYFITRNNGNIYAFDTSFVTYDGAEVPRIRTCQPIRDPDQQYRIANDVGFTIEEGETNYNVQNLGEINFITEDGNKLITEGSPIYFVTENGNYLVSEDGKNFVSEQIDTTDFNYLISEQDYIINTVPRIDLSISIDGGQSFSSDFGYVLNPIGIRRSRLMWWQLGAFNDLTCQFKFWGFGRFVATDGIVNARQ